MIKIVLELNSRLLFRFIHLSRCLSICAPAPHVREADRRDVDEMVVGRAVAQLPFEVESKIESVAFHPDGMCMALGGTDGFIELRDCEEGALMKDLQYQAKDMFMRHEQGVMCMAFGGKENSAGEMLTSGCQAG